MEIAISKAQRILPALIRLARQGEEIILTQGPRRIPVAKFEVLGQTLPAEISPPESPSNKKPLP
jgi:antitoxin (DNA-binding transcriptional repressor) of toxin-antitoxin stability system